MGEESAVLRCAVHHSHVSAYPRSLLPPASCASYHAPWPNETPRPTRAGSRKPINPPQTSPSHTYPTEPSITKASSISAWLSALTSSTSTPAPSPASSPQASSKPVRLRSSIRYWPSAIVPGRSSAKPSLRSSTPTRKLTAGKPPKAPCTPSPAPPSADQYRSPTTPTSTPPSTTPPE